MKSAELKRYIRSPREAKIIERIPFGVFSLDALTGGGIPKGKITIFEGAKSSGKTTVALKVIGNYLRLNKDKQVLYIDLEESFDHEWAINFINEEDLDRIILVDNTLYAEETIDVIVHILKSEEFNVGFLLLDSVANLIPITEADKSAMDETVGILARTLNKFFRKVLPIKTSYRNEGKDLTILLINQLRSKIGVQAFASSMTKPGGHYQDFLAHLDIRFYSIGNEVVDGIPVKMKHQFRIEKAKLSGATLQMKGEFKLVVVDHNGFKAGDFDDIPYLLNAAKKYKSIIREGNKWLWNNSSFRSLAELEDTIIGDIELLNKFYWDTVNAVANKKLGG